MKNIGKVSSFSGGELLLGLLNRCFWGAGTELTAFHGAPGGSEEVLTMGCNENIILLTLKRDKVNQVRVDMGNPGLD